MACLIPLLILICLLPLHAVAGERTSADFLLKFWQSEDGMPGNVARSLGQTSDGILWVATAEGLSRFDGLEFRPVPVSGDWSGGPPDFHRVFTLADDSVWVSTYGSGLFRLVKGELDCVLEEPPEPTRVLVMEMFLHQGGVYLVRKQSLWRLQGNEAHAVAEPRPDEAAAWAACTEASERRGRPADRAPLVRLIDRAGGTWNVTEHGMDYRAADGGAALPLPSLEGGLQPLDLLEDQEGNLWMASSAHGLIRVRARRVKSLVHEGGTYDSSALTAIRARDGTWWIANRHGGLDRIRDGVLQHVPIVAGGASRRPVSCLHEDRTGRLWVGSRDASLFQLNPETETVERQFLGKPSVSKIRVMAEDAEGRLWFGGDSKLYRWDGTAREDFSADPVIAGAELSSMAIDARGVLYAGTRQGAILTYDGKAFRQLGNPGDHPRGVISTILPLAPDELWVSTTGAGLFLRKDGRWHQFGKNRGIPDERLTSLGAADDGSLWMGSLGGIIRCSREELLRVRADATLPSWLRLDRADGLPSRECAGGSQPGLFKDRDGTLWFPTTAGLAGVMPERVEPNKIPPHLHLDTVEVNGQPQVLDGASAPLVAGPGQVRLRFGFTGVSLTAPEKVTYRVQLVGLDEKPRLTGTQRTIDYQPVPPGDYRFEISAINGDGIATAVPAMVRMVVRPHFWETGWFIGTTAVALLLVALSIGWLVARRRMNRKLQEVRLRGALVSERARISRDLHDDLGASLTEISLLLVLAAEESRDEELRPSLDHLTNRSREVVATLDEIVWATNPAHDSLSSVIEYLSFYARRFLAAAQLPVRIKVVTEIPAVTIGPRRRHNVFLAAREVLNNAVKYAEASAIAIEISVAEGQFIIAIRDDGKGFEMQRVEQGDGLTNLRERMKECGGSCRIESTPGKGTAVTLTVPLSIPPSQP